MAFLRRGVCPEKRDLSELYSAALDRFATSVKDLARAETAATFMDVYRESEKLRIACESARLMLAHHRRAHGC